MGDYQPQSSPSRPRQSSLGKYVLAAAIGALIAYIAGSVLTPGTTFALPQAGAASGEGILAVQARLSSEAYGLYLIDVKNQTILLYGYGGPWARGLRLLSARSFQFDRELVDFNSGQPSPQDVRKLLEVVPKDSDSSIESGKDSLTPAPSQPTTAPE